jgi:TetR/AcrR family transcriptional regulator, regulator of cefoperazone and chloramphenicol sensitivity
MTILIMNKKPTKKERLIMEAAPIFAEKGFRDTTVAEICEAAGANIAAVNYYFGDKESLYDEVWRYAFRVTSTTYPIDAGISGEVTVEESLYRYAFAVLSRIFSEGSAGLFPRLLNQEMASPTLALDKIATEALFPQSRLVEQAIRAFLGASCDEHVIWLCKHSVIGQCAFYNFSRPLRERVTGCGTMSVEAIDQMARHIARFSVGGLKEMQHAHSD